MREILFRGKRANKKDWVYGGVIPLDTDSGYVFIAEPFLSASTLPVYEIIKHHTHLVIPETVGQCTGLTDKNGKRIFEGDIVSFGINKRLMYVHWNDETLTWELTDIGTPIYEVNHLINTIELAEIQVESAYGEVFSEVIGNIYDNPELLNN
ncbi:MAG: hypothetical protein J6R59_10370 [Paludibacteraceae bacterium]|nr:hypothetical protein [Paludibacteraceae bacterium]